MKTRLLSYLELVLTGFLVIPAGQLWSQNASAVRKIIPLKDPAQPVTVKISAMTGGFSVMGYDGKEIIIESAPPGQVPKNKDRSHMEPRQAFHPGFPESQLTVNQDENVVSISIMPTAPPARIIFHIPSASRLKLSHCVNGDVMVDHVAGEIEADLVNGSLRLANVSGVVVAHTVNGRIQADFVAVPSEKPTAFATVNGSIEVAFPAALKAKVKLESMTGTVRCDFPIQGQRANGSSTLQTGPNDREIHPRLPGKTVAGAINDGGPEIKIKTVNGNIHLRKKN